MLLEIEAILHMSYGSMTDEHTKKMNQECFPEGDLNPLFRRVCLQQSFIFMSLKIDSASISYVKATPKLES